jgi:hypothetical protein
MIATSSTWFGQITFASSQELVVTRILPSAMRSNTTETLSALSNTSRVYGLRRARHPMGF